MLSKKFHIRNEIRRISYQKINRRSLPKYFKENDGEKEVQQLNFL